MAGQEAADTDAVDTLMESAGWSGSMPLWLVHQGILPYGEHCICAIDTKIVHQADTQYRWQEICLQFYALLPQLFCSNVVFILAASLRLSVPPLDALD